MVNGLFIDIESAQLIDRSLIPVESEPLKILHRLLVCARLDARAVQVFDSKHDLPALLSRQEPIHQKSAGVAEVRAPVGEGARRVTFMKRKYGGGAIAIAPETGTHYIPRRIACNC